MGLVIFFGTPTMYSTNGWGEFAGAVVVPVTTMAEHYGSHVFVLGIIAPFFSIVEAFSGTPAHQGTFNFAPRFIKVQLGTTFCI